MVNFKEDLMESLIDLLGVLSEHKQRHNVNYFIGTIKNMIAIIQNIENPELPNECIEKLRKMYKSMFFPRDGLSDFYILDSDATYMTKCNTQFSSLLNRIDALLEEVALNLGEMQKRWEITASSMKGSEKKRKYMTPFILNSRLRIFMCESEEESYEEILNLFLDAILYPFRYDEIVKKTIEKGEREFVKNLFYLGMESILEEFISTVEELNKKIEQILKIEKYQNFQAGNSREPLLQEL